MARDRIEFPQGYDWKITANNLMADMEMRLLADEELIDFIEDLFQMSNGNLVIDVGWYPENTKDGNFTIVLIENCKWDEPLMKHETTSIYEITSIINGVMREGTEYFRKYIR